MKIAFFTEGRWYGKVPSNHPNMRTDLAWVHLLDADHYCLYGSPPTIKYDIGVIIIPKHKTDVDISSLRLSCRKIAIMQEGPNDLWTDYTLKDQVDFLKLYEQVDFILCHNGCDIKYYKGLFNKPVFILPSVMVESGINIPRKSFNDRKLAIIGGNMCHWYNGMVSLIIAKNFSSTVFAPSMGRKVPGEERIEGLKHLPYLQYSEWIKKLNDFAIGVHLMPTIAAGTFSLNCAFLGIPCIGNEKVDTQRICHPLLSVDIQDVNQAIDMCIKLKHNDFFYKTCSENSIEMYNEKFHSSKFILKMNEIFESIL